MIQEPLADLHSPVHGLDPRARLAACVGLSLMAALAKDFSAPLCILGFGLACTLLVRPPWAYMLRQALAVNGFIILLWLLLPLTAPGRDVVTPLGLAVSREGLHLAALITLKANAVFFCMLALLATIPVNALGQAMTALGAPAKLAFLFVFTYRQVHVLAEEYARMRQAAALRGFLPATDRRTYRTFGALVAMVLVRGHDRGRRIYQAMLLRGFHGRFPSLHRFRFNRGDAGFLLLAAGVAVLAAALERPAWTAHG